MEIIFDRGGRPCDPELFFGVLAVCEETGSWHAVEEFLKMKKGIELANSPDAEIRARIEVWKVKLKAAVEYEAQHGYGALLKWEHPLNVDSRKYLVEELREVKARGVLIFKALDDMLLACS